MDEADMADKAIEQQIASGIARAHKEADKPQSLPYIGVCHWCESPVGAGRIFCSKECSDSHTHEAKRRRECGI